TCMASPCSRFEQMMLDDVSPGGQYALFTNDPFTPLEQEINVLYLNFRYVFPELLPGDAAYEAEAFYDENGNKISPHDPTFTLAMLVKYWNTDWAPRFLPYHPEKCKLDFCNANAAYMVWDNEVMQFIEKASDIPDIPGGSGLQYSYTNGAWLLPADPFFAPGAPGASYLSEMQADLNAYNVRIMGMTPSQGDAKGVTQVIDFLLY